MFVLAYFFRTVSVLLLCCFIVSEKVKRKGRTQKSLIDDYLDAYDVNIWPDASGNKSTKISVQLYINAFGSLNAANMDYSIDTFLRQRWKDVRLEHNYTRDKLSIMSKATQDKIWKPDTFIENVKEAKIHQVTRPNVLLRIDRQGNVLYSMRMHLRLICDMPFRNFPLDEQTCGVLLASYANTDDVIEYTWHKNAVEWENEIKIAQFIKRRDDEVGHKTKIYATGNFSRLYAKFFLRREKGYHILQTYIPTVLIVVISWVSFWLDPNAVPGRVTLGVTTLLTLTTLSAGIRQQLPPVSYVKAIDVWVGMCMIMVFGALLEFTLVNWLANKKVRPESTKCQLPKPFTCLVRQDEEDGGENKDGTVSPATYRTHARAVDRFCRLCFPAIYTLFNVWYWPYYIHFQDAVETEGIS